MTAEPQVVYSKDTNQVSLLDCTQNPTITVPVTRENKAGVDDRSIKSLKQ